MNTEITPVNDKEQSAIISTCILAAFADGGQSELERNEVKRIVETFSNEPFNFTAAYQQAAAGKLSLQEVIANLQTQNAKEQAYEMAVGICLVDDVISPAEEKFLAGLREALNLDPAEAANFQQTAAALIADPTSVPPVLAEGNNRDAQLDQLILNRSILAGALELMPNTLATMAIVPVQMQLVYQIGANYGFKLDRGHLKEFLATAGVGITSQIVEGYMSRFVNKVTKRFVGRLFAALATQVTESLFAFTTTYAVGHAAKSYYSGGRTLSPAQLKEVFSSRLKEANTLKVQYATDMAQLAANFKVTDILPLVKESRVAA